MSTNEGATHARIAILAMAEIKAAAEAFDQGESNVFDALDSVGAAIEAYKAAAQSLVHKSRQSRRGKAA